MRAEFRRPDEGDDAPVVATATWEGRAVAIDTEDPELGERLRHAFRPTPLVTDDAAYRRQGTTGEVALPPGDLTWFRAVAQVRVPAETGLVARWVPGVTSGGFDPAAGYRRFAEQVDRLTLGAAG